tara:strand:- start:314 stop:526 length:213 start_codon:yes stop_codon:yes gene_type:complete
MIKKYPKYLPQIIALVILFGTPILVLNIVELGLVFKPLGYLLTAILYGAFGILLVSGVYETFKWIKLKGQ